MTPTRYIAVANPAGKRWHSFAAELASRGIASRVIPWADLVARRGCLDSFDGLEEPGLLRVESPGRDESVMRLLLEAGDDSPGWRTASLPKGWLASPATYFAGFAKTLAGLHVSLAARSHLAQRAHLPDVVTMFDKNATARRLAEAGVPVPEMLDAPGDPVTLFDMLNSHRWPIAYVKLATGSSATGIVVLHALESRPWGVSTMLRIDGEYFNTRRLARLDGNELEWALHFLMGEGVCVQRGVTMAQVDGMNFDVRVILIGGRPEFTIFRLSPNPITNLHLGGRRGDWERCRAVVPTRAWLDAMDHAIGASACFRAAMVGVDLVFERHSMRSFVLEVNAFGDFFPGWTDARGRTVHGAEIEYDQLR